MTHLPVIFVSSYEHNSNLLPWRETGARVIAIPITDNGDFDYAALESELQAHASENCLKVGAFNAGSNLTGHLMDCDRIAILCHSYNCLATFDYAAVAPYVEINMNGPSKHRPFSFDVQPNVDFTYKDAVFISTHKLVGGPGSSGLLLAKKALLFDRKPFRPGGGPVFFVNEVDHEWVGDIEELEEAGTPGVLQDIRSGLAFQLKGQIGVETIWEKSKVIKAYAMQRMSKIPNLVLLGNNTLPKVAIFAFVIKSWYGKMLHFNFITSLLNDLFGLQTRSGCICSPMWGMKILGISFDLSMKLKEVLVDGFEIMKFGYTRFNLPYFATMEEVDYIIDCIEFVAKFGWMFLPNYNFDVEHGTCFSRDQKEQ